MRSILPAPRGARGRDAARSRGRRERRPRGGGLLAGDASPLVVKLNIEGEECTAVLETPAGAWEEVGELFVETHPWAACGADELAEHLAAAGLTRVESSASQVLRLRRARSPGSGRRTLPAEASLHGRPRARTERPRVPLVAQHLAEGTLEAFVVARRYKTAVLPVDEAVPRRDRLRAGDDHRLCERHRLQEHRRRPRVAVLAHGERHDPRAREPLPHLLEREVRLEPDVLRDREQRPPALVGRHDPKRDLGRAADDPEEQLEIPVRVGADRDDVLRRRLGRRQQAVGIDAERDELHGRGVPVAVEPVRQHARLVLAVGEDGRRGGEGGRVEAPHARRPEPLQALGQPDGGVDERRMQAPGPLEQHQRDPDRVHGRETTSAWFADRSDPSTPAKSPP